MFFDSIDLPKIQRGDPYEMTNINLDLASSVQ